MPAERLGSAGIRIACPDRKSGSVEQIFGRECESLDRLSHARQVSGRGNDLCNAEMDTSVIFRVVQLRYFGGQLSQST